MVDFNAAAVRFGKPGILRIAPLGTPEPAAGTPVGSLDHNSTWPAGWIPMGYTDEGSVFNYEISTENVEVAEELDILARVTTGRDASIEVALTEITKRNLHAAFNGGVVLGDGTAWTFEPPDLGTETRVMLGWDALRVTANNDLRIIFRQCLQGGSLGLENRKGATKSTISATFQLEKPSSGAKILKISGAAALNPTD
ncbi:MAG: hypothetical protein M3N52_11785 [Actinomycetota bacterium]|nr:hypothetical protein [Actinomycetota bacterium]